MTDHGPSPSEPWPVMKHAEDRAIVLPRRAVLFVPVPKSGCTSMLWLLARKAGVNPSSFYDSTAPEVTRAMGVHDVSAWPERHRWAEVPASRRQRIEASDDWLRFAIVREPARRLWSAWHSKLLLREPSFTRRFRGRAWFPRLPETTEELVEDFRTFVRALAAEPAARPADAHWAPQSHVLASGPVLNHVGCLENLSPTYDLLRSHLGDTARATLPHANESLLPFHPAVFDEACWDVVHTVYARDYRNYGYARPTPTREGFDAWHHEIAPLLPAVHQLAERHERIGKLQRLLTGEAADQDEV